MLVAQVPTTDLNLQNRDVYLIGTSSSIIRPFISSSFSTSSVSFAMPMPFRNAWVDRMFIYEGHFRFTFTGTPSGGTLLQNGHDALRSFPLNSVVKSAILTFDNQTFSFECSAMVHQLQRYWKYFKDCYTPQYPDTYNTYAEGVGAVNNPLSGYSNSVGNGGNMSPRGSYPFDTIAYNAGTGTTIVDLTIREPVLIPPLLREDSELSLGFTNVTDMALQLQFVSNINRMWCHSTTSPSGVITCTVEMPEAPALYIKYYTAPFGNNSIPQEVNYKTDVLTLYRPAIGTIPAATANNVSSNSIQLSCIPQWIQVSIGENENNQTFTQTDTAVTITKCSITFCNTGGILSTMSEHELYDMSRRNGLQDSFEMWHGVVPTIGTVTGKNTSGSFLKAKFAIDIPLTDPTLYVGKAGNFNIQINVDYINRGPQLTNAVWYIVTNVPGHITCGNGGVQKRVGIDANDLRGEMIPVSYGSVKEYFGGTFIDWVKKAAPKVNDWLKRTKAISKITGALGIPGVPGIASALGYGIDDVSDALSGGMSGGKLLTNGEIRRKVKRIGY